MATYSNAIYIDESGNGSPTYDILRYWVSAAVSLAFDQIQELDEGIRWILDNHFSPYVGESKGSTIQKYLLPGSTIMDVATDIKDVMDETGTIAWAAAASRGERPPQGFPISNPKTKDLARQLLMEGINNDLVADYHNANNCLITWDISDQQKLQDFSSSIARFRNLSDGTPRSDRLAPAALGSLSHDWSGLQTADIIAHCALHYLGGRLSLPRFKTEKAEAFRSQFLSRLQRARIGVLVGSRVTRPDKEV
jgi:hypothetical protein